MKQLDTHFRIPANGACNPDCVVQGDCYRFTVLTPEMIRMEYAEDGVFEDRPTQTVWNRSFDKPAFTVTDRPDRLEISTSAFHLVYNKRDFTPNNLYIDVKCRYTNYGGRWLFGATEYGNPPREHNLKGTARTLDRIDGATPLEFGLLDSSGRTFFDDSESLLLDEEGWVHPRRKGTVDCYYLGYGRNYYKAIHDYYLLTGAVPLLPRYAMGNWWSRYWKYSEDSYKELITRFERENLPFSVAVIDMDWHITEVPEKYGRGWTGYTWNRELFPDPRRFLTWLHDHGLKSSLNLHPADGVQPFEEAYPEMAKALGVNTENEDPVNFDITDRDFFDAYFRCLHHPHEEMGVDFWWMDWQQGKVSPVEGLDPLWMLNHYHFLDIGRGGKRGLLFSRYAGLGSHRYPVGFSGDSVISWESLDFQPYFTATASNVGYTWWSHDIGGHMKGIRDRELFVRWVQFGVFSPINRLHSNSNPFCGKEPWLYGREAEAILGDTLRLRHRMIPYLYTMNWRCHRDLVPVIVPMYYDYPEEAAAYEVPNQYFYGSELVVCPITSPTCHSTGMASVNAWIPDGTWTDLFTGFVYRGGKKTVLCRPLDRQAVLAKPGAIVPMGPADCGDNRIDNPELLEICIFPGASNTFTLFEDEGEGFGYREGRCASTRMSLDWQPRKAVFSLRVEGDPSVLPEQRGYRLHFRGFRADCSVQSDVSCTHRYDGATRTLTVEIPPSAPSRDLTVSVEGGFLVYDNVDLQERVFQFLDQAQIPMPLKDAVYDCYQRLVEPAAIAVHLNALRLEQPLLDALLEMTLC